MNTSYFESLQPGDRFEAMTLDGSKIRCVKEESSVFVFGKRRSRYGYRMSADYFLQQYASEVCLPKDPEIAWKRNIRRAILCLENSGLWPELLPYFRNLQKMSYADLEEMQKIHMSRLAWHRELDGRKRMTELWMPFAKKYPFAFEEDAEGNYSMDWDYLSGQSACQLKAMYFGKSINQTEKAAIQDALTHRRPYSTRVRTSYDVSFHYDPGSNHAWYSEEYKNCGNGHYYLALDAKTALFCEDD